MNPEQKLLDLDLATPAEATLLLVVLIAFAIGCVLGWLGIMWAWKKWRG
jgi:uncharacterized membrane protein YccC